MFPHYKNLNVNANIYNLINNVNYQIIYEITLFIFNSHVM